MIEPNTILCGNCLDLMRKLPDKSIDAVITSPPYWGLRDYGTPPVVWDGRDGCEHAWQSHHQPPKGGKNTPDNPPATGADRHTQTLGFRNGGIDTDFCSLCGAWRGSLGLEPDFHDYIRHLMQIMEQVWRVLKPTGTIFVNLGDSYSGSGKDIGTDRTTCKESYTDDDIVKTDWKQCKVPAKSLCAIPDRFKIAMIDANWVCRNEIIWFKRNCLNGGTRLYAKTQKGTMPSSLKDLVRLDPATVELWDGQKWNQVVSWTENTNPRDIRRIELQSGETIDCTGEHLFPVGGVDRRAADLVIGDVLDGCILPDNPVMGTNYLPDDIGWFVGMYIAEGSMSKACIQIACHEKETARYERLLKLAREYDGTCRMHSKCRSGKAASINIYSPILRGILEMYVGGNTAKDKHLTTKTWQRNNEFLSQLLVGYLEGDGHDDKGNARWRIGFTRNDQLARDLCCVCARLGYRIKLAKRTSACQTGVFKTYQGEIRMTQSGHRNEKNPREIVKIRRGKNMGKFWDITLAEAPYLFSTIGGTLIHNCMPSSAKDRFTVDFEKVFFFTKQGEYYFKQQLEPFRSSVGPRRDRNNEKYADMPGQFSEGERTFYEAGGRNMRCVWDIPTKPSSEPHFAMFPDTLVTPMLSAGCPVGGVVLDPFSGMGTVGVVAARLGMDFIGIELSEEYSEKAQKRVDAELAQLKLDI